MAMQQQVENARPTDKPTRPTSPEIKTIGQWQRNVNVVIYRGIVGFARLDIVRPSRHQDLL